MAYSMAIRQAVEMYLREDDWRYRFDEEKECITMGINLKSKIKSCDLRIRFYEKHYTVYAYIDINADEDSRLAVAEYLTRANYGLTSGNFELDMRDGEIRYKFTVDCGKNCDSIPSNSVIERSVIIPASMMQKYGDDLLAVMYGFKTPEQAVNDAESDK